MTDETVARNAANDAVCALVNGGSLRFYDATGASGTLLAQLALSNPAFAASSGGAAAANTITADSSNDATGTPLSYGFFNSGGTKIWSGPISEFSLSGLTGGQIISGGTTSVSAYTRTQPASSC